MICLLIYAFTINVHTPLGVHYLRWLLLLRAGFFAIHRTFLQDNGCKTDQKPADDGDRKAGFTFAARAYRQGFEVFIMQAPKGTDFNNVLLSQKREL